MTPQERTRNNLTARGYLVGTVERYKQFPDKNRRECPACKHQPMLKKNVDLYNAFDVIAVHPEKRETLLVQTTDHTHHANRRNKMLGSFEVKLCLLSGVRVVLQSWRKDEKINRWKLNEEWLSLHDFESAHFYPTTVAELLEIRRKEKLPDLPPGSALSFDPDCAKDLPF